MSEMLDQSDMDMKSTLQRLSKHVLKLEVTKKFEDKANEIVNHFKTQEYAVKKDVVYARRSDLLVVLKKHTNEELTKMNRCLDIVLSFIEQCQIEELKLGTSTELFDNLQRNMPDHVKDCFEDCSFKRIQLCDYKIQTKDEAKYPTVHLRLSDKSEDTHWKKYNVKYIKVICFASDSLTKWQRNGELRFTGVRSSDELFNDVFFFVTDIFHEKVLGIAKLIPPMLPYGNLKVDWLSSVELVSGEKFGTTTVIMKTSEGQKRFFEYYDQLHHLYTEKFEVMYIKINFLSIISY